MIKQSMILSTASATSSEPVVTKPTPVVVKCVIIKPSIPMEPAFDISKYIADERIINGTKALVYKKDLPLSYITQKYKITLEQLFAYNDMFPTSRFLENEMVYVESKKTEAQYYQYEVGEGESMRSISQKFAVQVSELIKRNGITPGCEPLPGEIIVLRGKREYPLRFRVAAKTYPVKTSVETSTSNDSRVHKVGTSETLYSISKQYNIPLDTLKRINGLSDEDIKIGQTLIVNL